MALGVRKFDSVFEIKFGSNNSVKNIIQKSITIKKSLKIPAK